MTIKELQDYWEQWMLKNHEVEHCYAKSKSLALEINFYRIDILTIKIVTSFN